MPLFSSLLSRRHRLVLTVSLLGAVCENNDLFDISSSPRSNLLVSAAPPNPIDLKHHGLPRALLQSSRVERARELAAMEQEVEDFNAVWVANSNGLAQSTSRRRLICLPLDERFDPPMGQFSHGHVQTGDKMSLPACFLKAITENRAEVPWLFSVRRVDGVTMEPRVHTKGEDDDNSNNNNILAAEELDEVVGGPLDFRAPPNYVFLPLWMMRSLGLHPRDIVDVKLHMAVPPGSFAMFRPHSSFSEGIANPSAVLETELRHYSSLTKGSTIGFDYQGTRYWFDVVELRSAPRGEKQPAVKVQDCDLSTDFVKAKDAHKKNKRADQANGKSK
jgi:ubiquitin fusion degradation protein 1